MDKIKVAINTSLAEVWGTGDEAGKPSEDWPYRLHYWGMAKGWALYRFDDGGVARYAGYDPEVGVISLPTSFAAATGSTNAGRSSWTTRPPREMARFPAVRNGWRRSMPWRARPWARMAITSSSGAITLNSRAAMSR